MRGRVMDADVLAQQAPTCPDLPTFAQAHNDWYRETLTEGRFKPVVTERIPLVEAGHAHELLERGGYAGKVVLVTSA
jgi:NADPH:quinone reductase-like Zn-dependent oxidoreductase